MIKIKKWKEIYCWVKYIKIFGKREKERESRGIFNVRNCKY